MVPAAGCPSRPSLEPAECCPLLYQLAQRNQQLSLQQNLILGLQQQMFHCCLQHDADQNQISKLVQLVGKLLEPECCKATSPAAEPCSAEEPLEAKGGLFFCFFLGALAASVPCRGESGR